MQSSATRVLLSVAAVLLTLSLVLAKTIEPSEVDTSFQRNQIEGNPDDVSLETALIRYLLTKEWLNRQRTSFDDERSRKRSYWKQCAFNAVSCFGRK